MSTSTHHQHFHHQAHGYDRDWGTELQRLETEALMREKSFFAGAAAWLAELHGAAERVLDIGSGPGVGTATLARAFPAAQVQAVDGSPVLLERAAERAAEHGFADRFSTAELQLPDGLSALDPADVIWSSGVVHHLGDQAAAVAALAGLLRPGGLLAIAEGGLPARSLPRDIGFGEPGLEARIEVALNQWFTDMRAATTGSTATVEDWPGMLAAAGLTPCGTRSFLVDLPAPLDADARGVVVDAWTKTSERLRPVLSDSDNAALDRLLDDSDPLGLARRPDLYRLSASTVYVGRAR